MADDPDPRPELSPAVTIVSALISELLARQASALHLESQPDGRLRARYRIGSQLQPGRQELLPAEHLNAITARLKLLAQLDLAEQRIPQHGIIQLPRNQGSRRLRLECFTSEHGPTLVLQQQLPHSSQSHLDELPLHDSQRQTLRELCQRGRGLMLFAGQRHCGRGQLLAACLREATQPSRSSTLITTNASIDELPDLTILRCRYELGLHYSPLLRVALRSDQDVIAFDSINDYDSLELALQAACEGRLLMARLNATSVSLALGRLTDMGMEPYLVHQGLLAIANTRLLPQLCEHCKQPDQAPSPEQLEQLCPQLDDAERLWSQQFRPGRCEHCRHTGFNGEVLCLGLYLPRQDSALRQRLGNSDTAPSINGDLRRDALLKARQGLSTIADALLNTPAS